MTNGKIQRVFRPSIRITDGISTGPTHGRNVVLAVIDFEAIGIFVEELRPLFARSTDDDSEGSIEKRREESLHNLLDVIRYVQRGHLLQRLLKRKER